MDLAYIQSGNAPRFAELQVAASVSTVGVPLLIPASNGAGLAACTTTSAANMVGCNLDTATYGTAQNSDNSDPAATVTVIINPDAVWKAKLSGSTTSGTALSAKTVSTASTTGLAVTTGFDYSSPTVDEGTIWGVTGANAGVVRKITSVSSTAATVTVAFPNDTAVGDTFIAVPFHPFQTPPVTLTATFDQIDCSVALATNVAELFCINGYTDGGFNGASDSYAFFMSNDHALGHRPT